MKFIFLFILNICMISSTAFRKSTHSAGMGQCVEVGTRARGRVAIRDSKEADGTQISISSVGWREFVSQVKLGKTGTR